MASAGALRDKVAFLQRTTDANGDRLGEWAEEFRRSAEVKRLRGGEEVIAGRLAGKKTSLITVRQDSETRQITTDWRAEDLATGDLFVIRDVARSGRTQREWFDILVEAANV